MKTCVDCKRDLPEDRGSLVQDWEKGGYAFVCYDCEPPFKAADSTAATDCYTSAAESAGRLQQPSLFNRPAQIAFRPERVLVVAHPYSNERSRYLLETFDHGMKRHAIWLRYMKDGSYRWECSCGTSRSCSVIDATLLAEARAHFDQVWDPPAVAIHHPFAIWNDRAFKMAPPSQQDLEQLAEELRA